MKSAREGLGAWLPHRRATCHDERVTNRATLCSVTLVTALAMFHAMAEESHQHHGSVPPASQPHSMTGPLGIPMSRDASGTSWQPDAAPHEAIHVMAGEWALMWHGNLFLGFDHQGSDRGDSQIVAPNWIMGMQSRWVGGGSLMLREMLSLEPLTLTREGYPLLLQSGETFEGEAIHDRQHPHDLFMELAALFTRPLGDALAFQVYAAPSGEPALGPTAFPHRASALFTPLAPIGHHWQDSTHISFGVLTAGLMTRRLKIEGSWFNGREPDEERYDFDFRRLDSYSGRLQYNPTDRWSMQVSYGYLDSPEELEPDESLHKLTASATVCQPAGGRVRSATTAVFGRNDSSLGPDTSSWLIETNITIGGHHVILGRGEYLRKTGHDSRARPDEGR